VPLGRTFVPLLASLLVVLAAAPFSLGQPIVALLLVGAVLVAGVFVVHDRPRLRNSVLLALVAVLVIRWVAHTHGETRPWLVLASHLAIAAYMLLLCLVCIAAVLRRQRITRDTVLGAVCGYILVGYVFTFAYAALEDFRPNSFSSAVPFPDRQGARIGALTPELMYFSLATLTSTGYGDIFPVERVGRMLASLEMLAGQLYLAAFVARLVGVMGTGTRLEDS
jgi:hypothetical protein